MPQSLNCALETLAKGNHSARLETRTKESTHIRKCVGIIPICIVNVTVAIDAAPFDLYLRREV